MPTTTPARILTGEDDPIVALTGRSNRDSLDRATAAGAVGHVMKPFSEGELVETLADVFAERRREAADRHFKVMIESMVRAGRPEHEIVAAVTEARER